MHREFFWDFWLELGKKNEGAAESLDDCEHLEEVAL